MDLVVWTMAIFGVVSLVRGVRTLRDLARRRGLEARDQFERLAEALAIALLGSIIVAVAFDAVGVF